jgi:PTH1 family peptidyl-tRNA hydrolase
MLTDRLAERWNGTWQKERRLGARLARARFGARVCWLCQPQTYMNASGESVGAVMRYHRLPVSGLLVVVDDADLPLGTMRLRSDGSSGGHRGLQSVEQHLGTRAYGRMRLGIGRRPDAGREIVGHVLGTFDAVESQWFARVLDRAVEAVECWLEAGLGQAMNRFNGAVEPPEQRQAE